MAIGYKEISEAELAWRDNRDQIALEIRQIMRRVSNGVLVELSEQFLSALERGEILELNPDKEALKSLLLKHSQKELGA
jgi:hypothetical protein